MSRLRVLLPVALLAAYVGLEWRSLAQLFIRLPAPQVEYTFLDGHKTDTNGLKGEPSLVVFWSIGCIPCLREIPHLVELHKQLSPRGLNIIGVAMPYDQPSRVVQFKERHKLPYHIALDVQGKIGLAFGGIQGTPTHYLIDRDGKVVQRHLGPLDPKRTLAQLEALL